MSTEWTPTPEASEQIRGKRILVMGSGSGSNFEALVHALRPHGIVFAGLFCDRPSAKILERAARLGVPSHTPSPLPPDADIHPKRHLNDAVMNFLAQPFDALALAGYMRILPKRVVEPYEGRILNIHPSLLPAYPGLNAIQQAYDAGETTIGITVHLVTPAVDDGPILGQSSLKVRRDNQAQNASEASPDASEAVTPIESLASVEARIHTLEHELYPRVLFQFLANGPHHPDTAE